MLKEKGYRVGIQGIVYIHLIGKPEVTSGGFLKRTLFNRTPVSPPHTDDQKATQP